MGEIIWWIGFIVMAFGLCWLLEESGKQKIKRKEELKVKEREQRINDVVEAIRRDRREKGS